MNPETELKTRQETENPHVAPQFNPHVAPQSPQNLQGKNIQGTNKENKQNKDIEDIETPSSVVNATDRYDDGLQNVANGFTDLIRG